MIDVKGSQLEKPTWFDMGESAGTYYLMPGKELSTKKKHLPYSTIELLQMALCKYIISLYYIWT